MRFMSNGPIFPESLLLQQEAGRVVFLCGAGVSLDAGMPNFEGLTEELLEKLNVSKESKIYKEFKPWLENDVSGHRTPLDIIYQMLHNEYDRNVVNRMVTKILEPFNSIAQNNTHHDTIAKISTNEFGEPQIITTNFDDHFEFALSHFPNLKIHCHKFPDLDAGELITGITHLHGRLKDKESDSHSYTLSSSEFGNAYLANGAQTRFLLSLIKNYTVVLVGYQAEDPPIKYLLQGLKLDKYDDQNKIYAFYEVRNEHTKNSWSEKGVELIGTNSFNDLWNSLEAWKEMVIDRKNWRRKIISLASKCPTKVAPHIRGQVVYLAKTEVGANLFSQSKVSPDPAWMFVFDKYQRLQNGTNSSEDISLDDDHVEGGTNLHEPTDQIIQDAISCSVECDTNNQQVRLGYLGQFNPNFEYNLCTLPNRLVNIANWFIENLNNPVTALWALTQWLLHPYLVREIHRKLLCCEINDATAIKVWGLILENQKEVSKFLTFGHFDEIKERIQREGWTQCICRDFDYFGAPFIFQSKTPRNTLPLNIENWNDLFEFMSSKWKLYYPKINLEYDSVKNFDLERVFRIFESHFRIASNLLTDLNKFDFRISTCYLKRDTNGGNIHGELKQVSQMFLRLFDRMAIINPELTKAIVLTWPENDPFIFRKFKFYALNHRNLFKANEAAKILINCSPESFWDYSARREIYFLILDRWNEFSKSDQKKLINKVLSGPPQLKDTDEEVSLKLTVKFATLLKLKGCYFTVEQTQKLNHLTDSTTNFDENSIHSLLTEYGTLDGNVNSETDISEIENLPAKEIVLKIYSIWENPHLSSIPIFHDLVKINPQKAIDALKYELNVCNNFHTNLWKILFSEWEFSEDQQILLLLPDILCELPEEKLVLILSSVTSWIRSYIHIVYKHDEKIAWYLVDLIIHCIKLEINNTYKSDDNNPMYTLLKKIYPNMKFTPSINDKIADCVYGLFEVLRYLFSLGNQELPIEFKDKIEKILEFDTCYLDKSIILISKNSYDLYKNDPEWTIARIIPWFSSNSSFVRSAWIGLLSLGEMPRGRFLGLIKSQLTEIFKNCLDLDSDSYKFASEWIVNMSIFPNSKIEKIDDEEVSECLRSMSDDTMCHVIKFIGKIGTENTSSWEENVIPFIENVWPKEARFKTDRSISAWISLLGDSHDSFPNLYPIVVNFLKQSNIDGFCLSKFYKSKNNQLPLAQKYPDEVLELMNLVVKNSSNYIRSIVKEIFKIIESTKPELANSNKYKLLCRKLKLT